MKDIKELKNNMDRVEKKIDERIPDHSSDDDEDVIPDSKPRKNMGKTSKTGWVNKLNVSFKMTSINR